MVIWGSGSRSTKVKGHVGGEILKFEGEFNRGHMRIITSGTRAYHGYPASVINFMDILISYFHFEIGCLFGLPSYYKADNRYIMETNSKTLLNLGKHDDRQSSVFF